jgi:hypothetical protein
MAALGTFSLHFCLMVQKTVFSRHEDIRGILKRIAGKIFDCVYFKNTSA